jgi:hypothetical protein
MANFVAFQLDGFQNDAFQTYVVEISIDDLRRFAKVYAKAEDGKLVAVSEAQALVAFSELQSIVAESGENTVFIQHKPKRASLEQPSGGS